MMTKEAWEYMVAVSDDDGFNWIAHGLDLASATECAREYADREDNDGKCYAVVIPVAASFGDMRNV